VKTREGSIKILGFFVIIITITFGSVAWAALEGTKVQYEENMERTISLEWSLLRNSLNLYLKQAKTDGQRMVDDVSERVQDRFGDNKEALALALEGYNEPNNHLREIMVAVVAENYFDNIVSNSTDPFVTRGNRVELDDSDNCATFGSSRTFESEFKMHANPFLAKEAFTRIKTADLENMNSAAIDRPIFFQFVSHPDGNPTYQNTWEEYIPLEHRGKKALILDSYDMAGLESYFRESLSWEKTFYSFEFITPSYIYNKEDIAGRKFVRGGLNTGVDRLAINIVFNYKQVIDHNPVLRSDLTKFKTIRKTLTKDFLRTEQNIYLLVLLLIIICTVAMKYTNKLAEEIHVANCTYRSVHSRRD